MVPRSTRRVAFSDVEVTITQGFLMMESEVTQRMWAEVMTTNPFAFKSCGPDCPADSVSWYDALKFANALSRREGLEPAYNLDGYNVVIRGRANGYRLPTVAQREWAARGGAEAIFSGSDNVDEVAWYAENARESTHVVCQKGRNGFGLCDMSGNVEEWVLDYDLLMNDGKVNDPVGQIDFPADGPSHLHLGGAFGDGDEWARIGHRTRSRPGIHSSSVGFRLVRPIPN
jgi:formylglycine-generating enzyme required for sulfatase activity